MFRHFLMSLHPIPPSAVRDNIPNDISMCRSAFLTTYVEPVNIYKTCTRKNDKLFQRRDWPCTGLLGKSDQWAQVPVPIHAGLLVYVYIKFYLIFLYCKCTDADTFSVAYPLLRSESTRDFTSDVKQFTRHYLYGILREKTKFSMVRKFQICFPGSDPRGFFTILYSGYRFVSIPT